MKALLRHRLYGRAVLRRRPSIRTIIVAQARFEIWAATRHRRIVFMVPTRGKILHFLLSRLSIRACLSWA